MCVYIYYTGCLLIIVRSAASISRAGIRDTQYMFMYMCMLVCTYGNSAFKVQAENAKEMRDIL